MNANLLTLYDITRYVMAVNDTNCYVMTLYGTYYDTMTYYRITHYMLKLVRYYDPYWYFMTCLQTMFN